MFLHRYAWPALAFLHLVAGIDATLAARAACGGLATVLAPLSADPQVQSYCSAHYPVPPTTTTTSTTVTSTATSTDSTTVTNTVSTDTTTTTTTTVTTTVTAASKKKREAAPAPNHDRTTTTTTKPATTTTTKAATTTTTKPASTTTTTKPISTTTTTKPASTTTTKGNNLSSFISAASSVIGSICTCFEGTRTSTVVSTSTASTTTTTTTTDTSIITTTTATVTETATTTTTTTAPATPTLRDCTNNPTSCGNCYCRTNQVNSNDYRCSDFKYIKDCQSDADCGPYQICNANSATAGDCESYADCDYSAASPQKVMFARDFAAMRPRGRKSAEDRG